MTDTAISPSHRTISASKLTETLAESLTAIKDADELTDKELGAFLGKGQDAGKAYRTGYAEMGFVSFLRGCERWNGRFANGVLAKIGMKLVPLAAVEISDQTLQTRLSKLLFEVSGALENGAIGEFEVQRMKRTLIEAGEAIDAYRAKSA